MIVLSLKLVSSLWIIVNILTSLCRVVYAQEVHTPVPASSERKAICDAMRLYVVKKDVLSALPKPIVFKIERMFVSGRYCSFEGVAMFNDGSAAIPDFLPDVVYETGLKVQGDRWEVIYDLTGTDVPSPEQVRQLVQSFPKDFPQILVPEFWRKLF